MKEEENVDSDVGSVITGLQYFSVQWRTFWIIIVTVFIAVMVVIVWSQSCCDEVRPVEYNCSQVQWDFSCCKVKGFWNPWDDCLETYQEVFEDECLKNEWGVRI